jgi:hypothetical protein
MIEKYVILTNDNKIIQFIFYKSDIIDSFPIGENQKIVLASSVNVDELEWYSA